MSSVEAAAALAIAGVLAAAAVAKGRDRAGTISSFSRLQLPAPRVLAIAVPIAEGVIAVVLLVAPPAGAWAAAVLLTAFTAVLLRAVLAGLDVPCACFGSSRREPVSQIEVVRNVLLLALAVVASGAASITDADLPGALVVAGAMTIGRLGLGLLDLRRRVGNVWAATLPGERR